MTTSDTNVSTPDPMWTKFGVRLGHTRKAVHPFPAGIPAPKRGTITERVRHWHTAHRHDGDARRRKKPAESIYAVRIWSNPRFIKIGRSGRTGARFDIIRTSTPFYLEVVMNCMVEDATRAEVALQSAFRDECVCGEWFHFDPDAEQEVVGALRQCVDPVPSPIDIFGGVAHDE